MDSPVIIIAGPTASGKTALSMRLGEHLSIEIINADVGQFYTPCTVGTAKPDWKNQSIPHHLFDIVDEPRDVTVAEYRERIVSLVSDIRKRGSVPVIVGGSFFYLKSLFFPPRDMPAHKDMSYGTHKSNQELWQELNTVDPARARQIHHNDRYRVARALAIWHATGVLPSEHEPQFIPPFKSHFVVLRPDRQALYERINKRTNLMIDGDDGLGWIEEVESLENSHWEQFLKRKKLIGYVHIFDWLRSSDTAKETLIERIQTDTRHYAKRQLIFWKRFEQQLVTADHGEAVPLIKNVESLDQETLDRVIHELVSTAQAAPSVS